jgi:hypothetical protein
LAVQDLPYCSAVAVTKLPHRVGAVGLSGVFYVVGETSAAKVHRTHDAPFNAISANWLVGPNGSVSHWLGMRQTTAEVR